MLKELTHPHPKGYAFIVYEPSTPGLPWLAVCLGPGGKVRAVEAFDTAEAAHARVNECAENFVQRFKGRKKASQSESIQLH